MSSLMYLTLTFSLLLLFSPAACATCGLSEPCTDGSCCSQYGFCGNTTGFCGNGCLSMCQASNSLSPSPAMSTNTSVDAVVSSAVTSEVFDQFFYDHNQAECPARGFYNLSSFLSAASTFPEFGTTGGSVLSKRELAAFFACASVVTSGGCYVEAINTSDVDCIDTLEWGCASGKKYYGRGPLQISWNTNYGPIGKALGFDGINDPDLVATNPVLSFRASLWFWMTVQPDQINSCHQAILLQSQGFNKVASILQGGPVDSILLEGLTNAYNNFCSILGVHPYDMSISPAPFPINVTKGASELLEHKSCLGSLCTMGSKVLGFGLPLAVGSSAALVLAFLFFSRKRRKWHDEERADYKMDLEKIQGLAETPIHFHFAMLETATEGFTAVLGKGGFGVVYKGVLPSGEAIAVKVLHDSMHTEEQFLREIETLGKLHHVNVVRLMGFCMEKSKRILVYEYISNNSLDKHLFNKSEGNDEGSPVLSWEKRYEIALGIARGLSYIHEECRHKIIHRDMKPQNILLDEFFCPKISDFGLAKIIKREENGVVSQMRGTPGYMAPEFWAELKGPLSTKFDVFSYGVVVLELVAGRPNVKEDASSEEMYLSEWAFARVASPAPIIDRRIVQLANPIQVKILVLVALWCIQEDPAQRPSMSRVVQYLEGSIDVPANPPHPFKGVNEGLSSTGATVSTEQLSYMEGR